MFSAQTAGYLTPSRGWWWVLGVCVLVPVMVWWQSVGDMRVYIDYRTPPGQTLYVLSKLAGLYALFLGWLQILLMLMKQSAPDGIACRWSLAYHRAFGFTVLGCMTLHVALFVAAASLRTGHLALGVLVPDFTGFYTMAVTLGLFGFYGIVSVAIAGVLRAAGRARAAWVHYAALPVFGLTYLHSLLIGTETRAEPMLVLYAVMGVTLLVACVFRLNRFRARSRST